MHLPRPRNIFETDLCIQSDKTLLIFATSKGLIEYVGQHNHRDERETDMMSSRGNMFTFHVQIPSHESKDMPPCAHCFNELAMSGSEEV